MLLENISLGKTLEIYVDREGYLYRLVSKVEDTNKRRVCVSLIAASGRAFRFRPEDDIRIVYRDEEHMWEWTEVKGGVGKLEGSPVHYFEITNAGRSYNRRSAYRVNLSEEVMIGYYQVPGIRKKLSILPAAIEEKRLDLEERLWRGEPVTEAEKEEIPDPKFVRGIVKDVSETGIGFYSDFEFDTEDGIFLDIPSASYGNLAVRANVIRKDELRLQGDNFRYKFYYGCVFSQTDKRLIKMIYEVQREMLKRHHWKEHQDEYGEE